MFILMFLVFSKNFYTVSISNYYTFYLMEKFGASVRTAQMLLFVYLFSAGARNARRRTRGRQDRQEARYMVVDTRFRAVRAHYALRELRVDDSFEHCHRVHNLVGVLRDTRLRAGASADESRAGVGNIFRVRIRDSGHRLRGARRNRGPFGDRVRLPAVLVLPPVGDNSVLPAEGENLAGDEGRTALRRRGGR